MKCEVATIVLIIGLWLNEISSSITLRHIDVEKITNVDVIVNPANCQLQHGGGIAGALARAAGPKLQQDSDAVVQSQPSNKIATGLVIVTNPHKLSGQGIKKIFHAIGPDCRNRTENKNRKVLLAKTYENIFVELNKQGLSSIAIPSISTGIFAYPDTNEAVVIAVSFIKKAVKNNVSITIFANDVKTLNFYKKALEKANVPFELILQK